MNRCLTSPCSRRAAARRRSRREPPGPRPAAEGQLVRPPVVRRVVTALAISFYAASFAAVGCSSTQNSPAVTERSAKSLDFRDLVARATGCWRLDFTPKSELERSGSEFAISFQATTALATGDAPGSPYGVVTIAGPLKTRQLCVYDVLGSASSLEPNYLVAYCAATVATDGTPSGEHGQLTFYSDSYGDRLRIGLTDEPMRPGEARKMLDLYIECIPCETNS